jgi:hypothetical protein
MVGNDQCGIVRTPYGVFNKAALIMRAGSVDAFPPAVSDTGKVAVAEQVPKPAG